ncbi:MAG: hypothetical protein Q8R02_17680 [Hyphomonadaceae bacterium]|nr:hypothetical protein [Hyphomonadaceae bacterium]
MRILVLSLLALGGCTPCPAAPTQAELTDGRVVAPHQQPLPLLVSVKDLMGGAIAFSAHVVETIDAIDAPLARGDWGAARLAASDLIASATLLTTPTTNGNVLDAFRKRDGEWRVLTKSMQDAGLDIVAAADARDRPALTAARRSLGEACQACHVHFGVHGQ